MTPFPLDTLRRLTNRTSQSHGAIASAVLSEPQSLRYVGFKGVSARIVVDLFGPGFTNHLSESKKETQIQYICFPIVSSTSIPPSSTYFIQFLYLPQPLS